MENGKYADGATGSGGDCGGVNNGRKTETLVETPLGRRRIREVSGERDFSGFREERASMRRIITLEKDMRCLRELVSSVLDNQDKLIKENQDLRNKYSEYESVMKLNNEIKKGMENLKKENEELKVKCSRYEESLKGLEVRLEGEKEEGGVCESKLEELKKAWKEQCEEEKINFAEVIKQQVREKTKDTVIQVIKEKEVLVRDTVDKKRCMVIFGLQEKKSPVKFTREKEEKELVKEIIQKVQDQEQRLEVEVEEIHRIGKYCEGGKRPLKVKMRSQVAVEEILARSGKLAESTEHKNIWIKRDMNLEEREKERELRNEAKEKNEKRTETERRKFYWRVLDMRLRKWYIRGRAEEMEETHQRTEEV